MSRSRRFEGRVALVTGAASGIGRATALQLAREGADVAVVDRDTEGAEATSKAIGALGSRAWPGLAAANRAARSGRRVELWYRIPDSRSRRRRPWRTRMQGDSRAEPR